MWRRLAELRSQPYEREVSIYCKRVIEKLKPRSIILFGSIATGKYGEWSDVDILIISEELPSNFLQRLRVLSELNPTLAPIEAIGYTPSEFMQMLERRHPTALDSAVDGKPLHDDGFFTQAKQAFDRVKARYDLVRIERGWDARALSSRASQ